MKGLSDKYVELIIKRTIKGSMTSKQAAQKLEVTKQYVNKLKSGINLKGFHSFLMETKGSNEIGKSQRKSATG